MPIHVFVLPSKNKARMRGESRSCCQSFSLYLVRSYSFGFEIRYEKYGMFLIKFSCIVFLRGGTVCNIFKGQDRNVLLKVSSRLQISWRFDILVFKI